MSGGNWKFGLKDLAISSGKTGISTKYPLEGKDYFHANNCDTHNAYHQVTQVELDLTKRQPDLFLTPYSLDLRLRPYYIGTFLLCKVTALMRS